MVYRFTDLPVSTNFNHYRPTGLPVLILIFGLPILNFSNAKFKFEAVFDWFYQFSW
jgi:hypothetical protein